MGLENYVSNSISTNILKSSIVKNEQKVSIFKPSINQIGYKSPRQDDITESDSVSTIQNQRIARNHQIVAPDADLSERGRSECLIVAPVGGQPVQPG